MPDQDGVPLRRRRGGPGPASVRWLEPSTNRRAGTGCPSRSASRCWSACATRCGATTCTTPTACPRLSRQRSRRSGPEVLTTRTLDGSYNDLDDPPMGMAGSRFGRNIPLDARPPADPRRRCSSPARARSSRALMTRDELIEATSVNALVAPWLQWMIRDWFSHGTSPTRRPVAIELAADDPWPERPMRDHAHAWTTRPGRRTCRLAADLAQHQHALVGRLADLRHHRGVPAVRPNRQDGKLRVEPNGLLPMPKSDGNPTARSPGFWLGLVLLQTLFTREHNAVCDMLRDALPGVGATRRSSSGRGWSSPP